MLRLSNCTEVLASLLPRPIVKPRLAVTLAIATSSQRPLTPLGRRVVDLVHELVPRELAGQPSPARGPAAVET